MLVQPARREYRTWLFDSRRWQHYRPRPADIVIATYSKCGTTWMQRIVGLLVFQTPEPRPIMEISAWIDRRFPEPIDALMARLEDQEHRRFSSRICPSMACRSTTRSSTFTSREMGATPACRFTTTL